MQKRKLKHEARKQRRAQKKAQEEEEQSSQDSDDESSDGDDEDGDDDDDEGDQSVAVDHLLLHSHPCVYMVARRHGLAKIQHDGQEKQTMFTKYCLVMDFML